MYLSTYRANLTMYGTNVPFLFSFINKFSPQLFPNRSRNEIHIKAKLLTFFLSNQKFAFLMHIFFSRNNIQSDIKEQCRLFCFNLVWFNKTSLSQCANVDRYLISKYRRNIFLRWNFLFCLKTVLGYRQKWKEQLQSYYNFTIGETRAI